jgi:hypothetical protein
MSAMPCPPRPRGAEVEQRRPESWLGHLETTTGGNEGTRSLTPAGEDHG